MLRIYFRLFSRGVGGAGGAPGVGRAGLRRDRRIAAAYGDGSRRSEHPKMLKITSDYAALELAETTRALSTPESRPRGAPTAHAPTAQIQCKTKTRQTATLAFWIFESRLQLLRSGATEHTSAVNAQWGLRRDPSCHRAGDAAESGEQRAQRRVQRRAQRSSCRACCHTCCRRSCSVASSRRWLSSAPAAREARRRRCGQGTLNGHPLHTHAPCETPGKGHS